AFFGAGVGDDGGPDAWGFCPGVLVGDDASFVADERAEDGEGDGGEHVGVDAEAVGGLLDHEADGVGEHVQGEVFLVPPAGPVPRHGLERLVAEVVLRLPGRRRARCVLAAFGLDDLDGGPPEGRGDFVGDDFDGVTLLAVLLPASLLEPPGDYDPSALRQGFADVLSEFSPADDVEEADGFLPFAVGLPAAVDGDAELGVGLAARGESEFRRPSDVADDGYAA